MNQKGFVSIILIIAVVILAGTAGYFALRKPTAEKNKSVVNNEQTTQAANQNKSTSTPVHTTISTTKSNKSIVQKISVVSDKYFSNLETLDELAENDLMVQQVLPPDFQFKIEKYTSPVLSEKGKTLTPADIPNWQNIQQSIKDSNLTNKKSLQVRDNEIVIALLEWHSEDPKTKQFCTPDGLSCETEHQWFKVSVNGYLADIYREEIRTFTFSNGTAINITVADDDVDFMVKILKN